MTEITCPATGEACTYLEVVPGASEIAAACTPEIVEIVKPPDGDCRVVYREFLRMLAANAALTKEGAINA